MASLCFPGATPSISNQEAIGLIIASIAIEEAGWRNVIGIEKLQCILDAMPRSDCSAGAMEAALGISGDIRALLYTILQKEVLLKMQMDDALSTTAARSNRPYQVSRKHYRANKHG